MSDNIPFEIQVEIIKRLPVRSLIQFRSVSKSWKSLIDGSDFIVSYSVQQQHQHLLVSYTQLKFVSVAEDDTFPHQRASLTVPPFVNMLNYPKIIGCSRGLLCLYGYFDNGCDGGSGSAVIWNPSIRKAVAVVVPNGECGTILGFGVFRDTKIVKITQNISCVHWQVEVFSLSTGAWRSPYSNGLLSKSVSIKNVHVVVDGFLYWLATDKTTKDGKVRSYNLIISFDMTSEEFRKVNLPDTLAHHTRHWDFSMYKLRESLVVFENDFEDIKLDLTVWRIENGVFTKLFTFIMLHAPAGRVKGFKKTSEPILQTSQSNVAGSLVVYEPYSRHINDIGINGDKSSFRVDPYMETLLLLDQPDFVIYDNGNRHISKPLREE